MKKYALAALFLLQGGCVSIATYEEQMRRCKAVGLRADESEARVSQLEQDLAEKVAESEELQRGLAELQSTRDELEQKLKSDIAKGEVAVEASPRGLTITLGDKVLFASGAWELQLRGQRVLGQVAGVLKKVSDKQIRVEGHTDNVPISGALRQRFPSNWDLSSARAAAVIRFLEKQGVDPKLLALAAWGDQRPVGDNKTPDGRRMNRRVEISLVPLPEGNAQ